MLKTRSRHGPRVEPTFVEIRVSRTFPYPVEKTFAWLTDYQDDDPGRTTAVVKRRPVIARTKDKVTLEGEIELLGSRGIGKVEVSLMPPDHYVANIIEGAGRGSVYDYKLTPVPGGKSRLDVNYRIRVKRWKSRIRVTLAKPFAKRRLNVMWDGFEAAMKKDFDAS